MLKGVREMSQGNVLQAFSLDHVMKLTGLTSVQLRSWDKEGFFSPDYAYEDRRSPYSRIYSFRDVVGLRTIATLRHVHHISHQELRRVARKLQEMGFEHWTDVKLYVVKRKVHFQIPNSDRVIGVLDHQYAMLAVLDVIQDVEARVCDIQKRASDQYGKIERHKHVGRNSPVIAGTRIPVAAIRRYHAAGYSNEHILREYPSLTASDIETALSCEERVA